MGTMGSQTSGLASLEVSSLYDRTCTKDTLGTSGFGEALALVFPASFHQLHFSCPQHWAFKAPTASY